ncbi:MAG: vWA domain-containing protein [Candidatus Paceibacterota bacterium]
MKKNVKFDENYYLISQEANSTVTVEVAKKTNHIFVVDVSGSMSWELPKIRTQLKNKLSNIMKEGDTITIVWFSGSRDAGILKEEVEVKSLKTLSDLHDAIDKWLRPVGLTAFLKPLELVKEVIGRIRKNRPDSVFSMIFLTDGCNNDCSWNDVIKTLKGLETEIASSTFVEYGYYADSRALTQMASVLGGEKISCDGFDDFEPMFDAKISSSVYGGKKVVVNITDKYLYDFAFSVGKDGSVLLYNIQDGKIMVGSDVKEVYFFSPNGVGGGTIIDGALYAAIYVLSDKLMNDDAEKVFYALGDNHYYRMLANAFGKQKLNAFKAAIKECVADVSKRFPDGGRAAIQKVPDDAYCLMNLIEDLGNLEGCLFYKGHSDFNYNLIGRKRVARGENLSEADKKRLSEAKNVEEISKITEELKQKNVEISFVDSDPNRGYPLTDLVWNEKRANLSIRIYIEGEAITPKNKFSIEKVASFRYKTYTLIKDGIVNIKKLPVSFSPELDQLLVKYNVSHTIDVVNKVVVIDLTSLPLINRGMVKSISAKGLAIQEWELQKLQADKKVYDYFRKSLFPKESKSFVELLGQEAADWLKTIGITDYNGFTPLTDAEESTDFYLSVNLETKIKGFSSLPKVEDVIAKLKSGTSLKPSEAIMSDAVKKYQAQLESEMYQSLNEEQQKGVLKTYLITKSDILNKKRRKALQEIAQIKFSLILSKKWFTEFKTFDENKLSLKLDGQDLEFTFDLSEKEEKI